MALFVYNSTFADFAAGLELELGGAWLRPTLWSRVPRPAWEQLLLDRVMMQFVAGVVNRSGDPLPYGLIAALDFNPRSLTCHVDAAFRPGVGTEELIIADVCEFLSIIGKHWPLRHAYVDQCASPESAWNPALANLVEVARIPESAFVRGEFVDVVRYRYEWSS